MRRARSCPENSGGNAGAAFTATAGKNGAASTGGHTTAEAVLFSATTVVGLKSALAHVELRWVSSTSRLSRLDHDATQISND